MIPLRAALIALMLTLAPAPSASADAPAGAAPDSPQRHLLASLAEVVDREPRHVGAMYVAARTAAGIGNEPLALEWLDRLERIGLGDALDPDDFAPIAGSAGFRERAARFAAAAPPVGRAARVRELRGGDILPEGTAWDARRREVLISSGRQRTVFAVDAKGRCRPLVPPADGGLLAALGMVVDPAADVLWVASAAAPFMTPNPPQEAGTARLVRIDLSRGRVAMSYALPGPGLLNDLALAPDGSVYVTESRGGTVYRLAPGAQTLAAILPADTFEGPNGIVTLEGGDLLVADFHGLWRVRDPAGSHPERTRLAARDSMYLGGFDGLARSGDRVVGIQNLVGRSRIWSLGLERGSDTVIPNLLMRGHPDFMNPTTGAIAGDEFHFVADTKLQASRPDGSIAPLPRGRTGHRLITLRLPARSRPSLRR